jgi:hypothetical protein
MANARGAAIPGGGKSTPFLDRPFCCNSGLRKDLCVTKKLDSLG